MTKKESITRKEKQRFKREEKIESERARVVELFISENGRPDKERSSYRIIAKRFDKSHMWVKDIKDRSLIAVHKVKKGVKYTVYHKVSNYKQSLKRCRRGPPPGTYSKRRIDATQIVLDTKKKYIHLGAAKIVMIAGVPLSAPTVHNILMNAGYEPVTMRLGKVYKSFERDHPNDMWQIDYVELGIDSLTGRKVESLSIIDDHSRFVFTPNARISFTTEDVLELLEYAISIYGVPKEILSDHGTQWASNNGGDTRFDEWCKSKGIKHTMGRVRKPTTQGKVERFHGTLRREADLPKKATVEEYQRILENFVEFYNWKRPHWSHNLDTPAKRYFGSSKSAESRFVTA